MADAFNIQEPRDNSVAQAGDTYARLMATGAQQRQAQALDQQRMQANMLQLAHAQQVAKGQTATPQQGAGTSPIMQSVMKAKQLAASSLDRESLSPDQQRQLDEVTKDPNIDYKTHQQVIEQIRQGQNFQRTTQHQGQVEQDKSTRLNQQQSMAQQRLRATDSYHQLTAAQKEIDAVKKESGNGLLVDLDSPAQKGEAPEAQALRQRYAAAQQKLTAAQQAHEDLLQRYGEQMPGGDGTEDQQKGAEFHQPTGQVRADQPGYMSITPSQSAKPNQRQSDTQGLQTKNAPGSKGPATPDIIRAYHQRVGNDPAAIKAALKADGYTF